MNEELRALKQRLHGMIDREALTQLACDLVNIPSPTGFEKACADYIIGRYKAAGIKVLEQSFEDQRANAIGIIKGDGSGATLMLNGHMDTSYHGDEKYLPDRPGYRPRAVIDGEWIYGLGIYNMKGTLACFLHALEIIQKAGVNFKGDIILAAVAGEIEKSQVDHYQGPLYRGGACGTWYAITHGAIADFCVVGEPTGMALCKAHGGYVWTRITLVGDPMHTVFGHKKNNTINNMMKVMQAIQAWGDEYESRRASHGMPAHVTLSAIEGGWPYRCSRVPVYCSLYVDTRLLPGHEPLEVQREIEAVLGRLREKDPDLATLAMDTQVFMNQWGSECSPEEFIYRQMAKAHEEVHGTPVDVIALPFASDACELTRHGIPALNYGATGRTRQLSSGQHFDKGQSDWNPKQGEHASIEDMVKATMAYLSLMVNVCSETRESLGIERKAMPAHGNDRSAATKLGGHVIGIGAVCLALLGGSDASALDYPAKPIRFVVPFPASGFSDILGRLVAQRLSELAGQPVIADNRPGASGNIGADIVAKAAPDGYTLLVNSFNFVVNPGIMELPFDPLKDFAPVSLIADGPPLVMVVAASTTFKSVPELIRHARASPGTLNFATSGIGTSPHLAIQLMNATSGTKIVPIPYKGSSPALTAVVNGEVTAAFPNLPAALPLLAAGRLRALAVTSAQRTTALPEIPTMAESGMPGFELTGFLGLLAPARTPKPIVSKLHETLHAMSAENAFISRLGDYGMRSIGSRPGEFSEFLRAQIDKWTALLKK